MTTVIIGGGAAGLTAALTAAGRGQRVLVLERNRKALKKLGVTGNGRGNLLNSGAPVYFGGEAFARAVLTRENYSDLCGFFTSLGVPLREEGEGRVYPAALQAAVAVQALLLRAEQLGVTLLPLTRALAITRNGAGFHIRVRQTKPSPNANEPSAEKEWEIQADRVIVTVGGAAAPAHGTDGTGYGLLTGLGHTLTPLKPALCALKTDSKRLSGLSGQRVRARLALLSPQGKPLRVTEGEALFGDDAVSGIAAMQLARFHEPGATLALDLRPEINGEDAPALLRSLAGMRADRPVADLLTGALTTPVARLVLREAGMGRLDLPVSRLTLADMARLADTLGCVRLPVTGTRGFEQAQVTAGGIRTQEFSPETMESLRCPGLYAAGEVLDVDGDCGGFNLMFAFASGILAGRG